MTVVKNYSGMWCHMSVIPALQGLRQNDSELEVGFRHTVKPSLTKARARNLA